MRRCVRCNIAMVENCGIKVKGAAYGLVLTDDQNKWWGGRMEQPKVAICPQCGEVSIYLENVDKLKNKTTLSCFLTLSRRFATRAFWENGFQDFPRNPTLTQNNRKYQTVENAENPVKYSPRASPFSRWRFALLCHRQRLAEQSA